MAIQVAFDIGRIDLRSGGVSPYCQRLLKLFQEQIDSEFRVRVVTSSRSLKIQRLMNILPGVNAICQRSPFAGLVPFDIYHSPTQVVRSAGIPSVVTMHDVQELHFPQYFTSAERQDRAIHYRRVIEQSSAVVVSFEHVRSDVLRFFDVPARRVHVMPLPLRYCDLPSVSDEDVSSTVTRLSLPPQFILYPAQTWPHKNHAGLLDALRVLHDRGLKLNLVCTGHVNDYFHREIQPQIAKAGLTDHVHMLGELDLRSLAATFRASRAVVIPTLYEAGSFPLIEAMLMQHPVICSSTTSLPDTIADQRFVFDPNQVQQIADLTERIVTNETFRHANVENSRKQTGKWLEIDVAARYRDLWRSLI